MNCDKCGTVMQKRGFTSKGKQKYHCIACEAKNKQAEDAVSRLVIKGNEAELSVRTHEVIKNERDLIRVAKINTDEWSVKEWEVTMWEAPRANKHKDLTFKDGLVTGSMNDEGKTTVVDLWRVNVKLIRKLSEKRAYDWKEGFVAELKKQAPKFPKIKYPKTKSSYVYELGFPDVQFGRLTWAEESGENFDLKIAHRVVELAVNDLLSRVRGMRIKEIIIPLGNDFYNADNPEEETTHGTRQQQDTRFEKTFRAGVKLCRLIIETAVQIAPVHVVMLPGNHDENVSFFLGEVLAGTYNHVREITFDLRVRHHKYRSWGRNLLGYAHGYSEKLSELPLTMATEEPILWGGSINREWHTGDKHHLLTKKTATPRRESEEDLTTERDFNGVTIRQLRSLAGIDKWTFNKLFIGTPKSAQGFLWDDYSGVVGSFYANIDKKEYQ